MTEGDAAKSRPMSRPNRPLQGLLQAMRRERGLLLRAMFVSAARQMALVVAGHRRRRNGSADRSQRG